MARSDEKRPIRATLRIDIETCRYRMRINPEYPVNEFTKEYVDYRKRFGDCVQRIKDDVLRTERLKMQAQDEVNDKLADQISPGNKDADK